MVRFTRLRVVAALTVALLALGTTAAPAGAATTLVNCKGTCGAWSVVDTSSNPGATCDYETASYDLDVISANPPTMFGPYATKTPVMWKLNILRSTNFGASWKRTYGSSWQKAKASKTQSAHGSGGGFTRRSWSAPDPNPTGWFKVRLLLRWKNSAGNVVGNAKVEYDYYTRRWNGNTDQSTDNCIQDW